MVKNPSNEDYRLLGSLLDREAEVHVDEHSRPHWGQSGVVAFLTMRLADSLPREVVQRWDRERLEFIRRCGVDNGNNWREGREFLETEDRIRFDKQFNRMREDELDTCHGKCVLRELKTAEVVASALLHFDRDRYLMGDFVIMPNHVHMLVAFENPEDVRKQCTSWMRFTAREINRMRDTRGSLWQEEPFDHLVRSEEQLKYLRCYIEQNPRKAKLKRGEYYYRRSDHAF